MALWVRFARDGAEGFGVLAEGAIAVHGGGMFDGAVATGEVVAAEGVRLLAPVRPGKFVGLWNNVRSVAIAQEHGIPDYPLFFLKATSSIIGTEETFEAPGGYDGRVVYEGELGVVIGRACKNVNEAEAEAAIFGYTCVNDVTAVGLFGDNPKFEQWARAKSCDGFGPVGPGVATGLDWRGLVIRTLLNGRERQNYPASDLILSPPQIVSLLSREMTLFPGDLISCGTGSGILPMRPGMAVEVAIEGVGVLRNRFAA